MTEGRVSETLLTVDENGEEDERCSRGSKHQTLSEFLRSLEGEESQE